MRLSLPAPLKSLRFRSTLLVVALLALLVAPHPVAAQAPLVSGLGGVAGFGTSCLGENDDGSSNAIDIRAAFPSGLRFFTMTHTSIVVNTNGNITFSGNEPTYTAEAFPVAARPMIAPFWADVDTRQEEELFPGFPLGCSGPGDGEAVIGPACMNPSQNGIWWSVTPGRIVVTWDRVGYYACHDDRRMSFQLVLSAAPGCAGAGDFDVEFRYNRCEWEAGDASGGSGGFGGTEAQAGFDAGDEMNYIAIDGSMMPGIANRLCTMSNVGTTGVWRFQVRSGAVLCPDAGDACTISGLTGACAMGRTNCVGSGTECVQQVFPSAERCDNLDNDCNGMADDGDPRALCNVGEVCSGGVCVGACFEGSCGAGLECNASGVCVDPLCASVTCPEGERCVGGACQPACEGVVCPAGRSCLAGRCVDVCAGLTCDDCTTCDDGACVARCDMGGTCPAGETCGAMGRCEESACVGVTCGPGSYCRAGTCVDACVGVTCPVGETCMTGECVAIDRPDAARPDTGPPPPFDGGGVLADGGMTGMDVGTGEDAGRVRPPREGGCGCRASAPSTPSFLGMLSVSLLGLVRWSRSRRSGPRP